LSQTNIPVDNIDPAFIARDDVSVAKAIAKQYRDAGIDPSSAYDSVEDALADFGGLSEFN
jgi:hypothetical protein